jgi:hypothetical protein
VKTTSAARALLFGTAACLHVTTSVASHPPRMPEVREVFVRDAAPGTVVLATRYGGHYVTFDGGASWTNICHEALGADDTETYGALFTPAGTLVAATGFRGVAVSNDACTWEGWAPQEPSFITELVRLGESSVLALDSQEPAHLWWRGASGGPFLRYGSGLPGAVTVTSIAASRDGSRLYVAGSGSAGVSLFRSSDAADSWEALPMPDTQGLTAKLVGVAADAPDVVVARLSGNAHGRVVLSRTGGDSWETVHEAAHDVPAASLAPDGTLFFGGPADGLHRGSVVEVGAGFQQIADIRPLSLTATEGRVFAVTSQVEDGHSVALSTDGGHTFAPFFDVCRATLASACGAGSTVGVACSTGIETMPWQPLGNACHTPTGEPDVPPPPPGGEAPTGMGAPPAANEPEGASCTVSPRSRGGASALVTLGAALACSLWTIRRRHGVTPPRSARSTGRSWGSSRPRVSTPGRSCA